MGKRNIHTFSPESLEKLKATTKAIEELGVKLGQIGVDSQKRIVDSVNESIKKIKPISINFTGGTHD